MKLGLRRLDSSILEDLWFWRFWMTWHMLILAFDAYIISANGIQHVCWVLGVNERGVIFIYFFIFIWLIYYFVLLFNLNFNRSLTVVIYCSLLSASNRLLQSASVGNPELDQLHTSPIWPPEFKPNLLLAEMMLCISHVTMITILCEYRHILKFRADSA